MLSKIENINDIFKLPIYYIEKKDKIPSNIIQDLELVKTIEDTNSSEPLYKHFFSCEPTSFSDQIILQVSEYYSYDLDFLKDSQKLLQKYTPSSNSEKYEKYGYNMIQQYWEEIKNDTGFKDRYYYIDWSYWEWLNHYEAFLQIMSLYNMTSPVISLLSPIVILIIPFFVIQMKGLDINIQEYITILKSIISNHALGRLFTDFQKVSNEQKIYLFMSAAFYVFSIYQNILTCIRFHQNMGYIHNALDEIKKYIDYTDTRIENFLKFSFNHNSYSQFNNELIRQRETLNTWKKNLDNITPYKLSISKITQIGKVLKHFYEFYVNQEINDAMMYSFGFHGYLDCLEGLIQNIQQKYVCFSKLKNKKKDINKNKFVKSYYGPLKNKKHTKNDIVLNKNIIITGPNASGKTTVLKSTLINIILTQQFGCGFYGKSTLYPYRYIHCYLNIPDTSGRDSLFQAEARRCKEIIDIVEANPKDTHFCVFDELYSGTNPEEAVLSATAFMSYLVKNNFLSCMLTTHFIEFCNKMDKNERIQNCHMETKNNNGKLEYKYTIQKGISNVKGGIQVLSQLNYPREILEQLVI